MEIPREIRQMLTLVRQQHPETAELPNEILVKMMTEAMQMQLDNSPDEQDFEKMHGSELGQMGQQFMNIGDQRGIANVYGNIGAIHQELGNFDQTLEMYQKSVEIKKQIGDEPNLAQTYCNMGVLYNTMGDTEQSLAYYHKALNIMERIGDRHNAARTYFNLGNLYSNQGDRDQARAHYEKAKALFEMVEDSQMAQKAALKLRLLRDMLHS